MVHDVHFLTPMIALNEQPVVCFTPDFEEFEQVARLHWSPIFHFVLASVRDRSVAEDVTQDCFFNAYKGWKQFRGDSSVRTWLMRIAVNVIHNSVRSQRVRFWSRSTHMDPLSIDESLPDSKPSPETQVVFQERLRQIWKALELTSAKQRTVFHLRFAEDLECHEIAERMGISEGAVKVHLFRAVRAVRKTHRRQRHH
jgi:RNA polymerase sigma-70 factor (ECF subfamily)